MSDRTSSNGDGVIRIGRKGLKKFAFGDNGRPFEVDVVTTYQQWILIDEQLRTEDAVSKEGVAYKTIPTVAMVTYHQSAVEFAKGMMPTPVTTDEQEITVAEALEFIAHLSEEYDKLAVFFRPKKPEKEDSPDTSGVELGFSVEEESSRISTN